MKRMTVYIRRGLWFALALVTASCEVATEDQPAVPQPEMIEVTLSTAGRDIVIEEHSRTTLADDGVTLGWSNDDRMALWIDSSSGGSVVEGAPFALWRYDSEYDNAYFRGSVPAMEQDTYNYYAVSPLPVERNGKTASYDIPAVQNGEYNSAYNILVAEPTVGGDPLVAGYNNSMQLKFRSEVHILRIRIPQNDLGEKITRLDLSFTQPVVGRLDVDVANPGNATLRSEGASDVISLQFAEPKDAGDIVYVTIAPVAFGANEPVQMLSTGVICESQVQSFAGKSFEAGHVTPIAYTPKFGRYIGTIIRFNLNETGRNTLGEDIYEFTLDIADAGDARFDNGQTSRTFKVSDADVEGNYDIFIGNTSGIDVELLSGKKINVTYESEHARVTDSFTMGNIITDVTNAGNRIPDVPYLMFEDFSDVTAGSSNYTVSSGYGNKVNAGSLDGVGLEGWTAASWKTTANTSLSISAYCGTWSLFGKANIIFVRTDSKPLPLKKAAKVNISYNVSAKTDANNATPHCYFGTTTRTGAINGTTGGNACLPDRSLDDYTLDKNGSETNISTYKSSSGVDADSATRLTWCMCYDKSGGTISSISNKYIYLYIDNIKVQIAN